jgi:hypothetical protein
MGGFLCFLRLTDRSQSLDFDRRWRVKWSVSEPTLEELVPVTQVAGRRLFSAPIVPTESDAAASAISLLAPSLGGLGPVYDCGN